MIVDVMIDMCAAPALLGTAHTATVLECTHYTVHIFDCDRVTLILLTAYETVRERTSHDEPSVQYTVQLYTLDTVNRYQYCLLTSDYLPVMKLLHTLR